MVILNTEFGLIWATPWPDEKEFFLIFSKIRNSGNSQNSVWEPNFFLGTLYQNFFCFTLSLHWWYSMPSKMPIQMVQMPIKFSKIRNSRNSQNSVWKPIFFLGKLYQQLFGFTLSLHWWYSIPSLVWFGQLLDPMKKNFFKILKNSQFAKFAKFRMKNHFFPRQSIPTTFLLCTLITLLILNTEFGLIWTTPWPAEKKFKIFKISHFAKFPKFRMKTQLFPRHALTIFFCFTLSLNWWYSIPLLVWFQQLLNPMKKTYF